ncbi:Stage II sporulation protein E SpoIIE [Metschnikowia aff. pulcherrima]|uniref:Stage II sporulation protein E SpoIIE n=1 Tax=Metschnikowia aff. pulcherrima TaxID=2163413 RepID=A0A4V1ADG2_9ASCO|nr:Stage II sporulation protein E SpoIIE [Metschnikowia aff. pulcherrima]
MVSPTKFISHLLQSIFVAFALLPGLALAFAPKDRDPNIAKNESPSLLDSTNWVRFNRFTHILDDVLHQLALENQEDSEVFARFTRKPNNVLQIEFTDEPSPSDLEESDSSLQVSFVSGEESPNSENHVTISLGSMGSLYPELSFFHNEETNDNVELRVDDSQLKPSPRTRLHTATFYTDIHPVNGEHDEKLSGSTQTSLISLEIAKGRALSYSEESELDETFYETIPFGEYGDDYDEDEDVFLMTSSDDGLTHHSEGEEFEVPAGTTDSKEGKVNVRNLPDSNLGSSDGYAGSSDTLRPEDLEELQTAAFKSDQPLLTTNPETLDSTEKPGRLRAFYEFLKSIFRSGSRIFTSRDKSGKQVVDAESETTANVFFSIGRAAWSDNGVIESNVGIKGGLDDSFVSYSGDGKSVAFGVADGRKLEKEGPNHRFISENMCRSATWIFKNGNSLMEMSPSDLMKMSYEQTISNKSVSAGSTAPLFGIIDSTKTLHLSYAGAPWAAVYRGGDFVYDTGIITNPEDEIYPFEKRVSLAIAPDSKHISDRIRSAFKSVDEDVWALQNGDIIIAATNGLYRRLRSEDVSKSMKISLARNLDMTIAATSLVQMAIGELQVDLDDELFWVLSEEKKEDIAVVMIKVL